MLLLAFNINCQVRLKLLSLLVVHLCNKAISNKEKKELIPKLPDIKYVITCITEKLANYLIGIFNKP